MSVLLTREKPGRQPGWRQRLIETLLSMPEPPPRRPKVTYENLLRWRRIIWQIGNFLVYS